MVKWLMRRGTAAFERQWNYDASYLHEIIEASPRATASTLMPSALLCGIESEKSCWNRATRSAGVVKGGVAMQSS